VTTSDLDDDVVGVEWDVFLDWFKTVWHQGQHVSIIGPTGCGKTTAAVGIAKLRRWVIALDPKGGDTTLSDSGFRRVREWPLPKDVLQDVAEGRSARVVQGFMPRKMAEFTVLKELLRDTIEGVWLDGGWTVIVDETQIACDRKMMNLGPQVEKMLVAARDKKLSTITLFQAPAWVPTATTRQATWIIIFPTRDETVIKTLAAKIGRDWHDLKYILHMLPDHHCVIAGLNPRDPLVLTKPEKVGR
jgi:energy-coupling factor transporter ATP-binding protein EcfA2